MAHHSPNWHPALRAHHSPAHPILCPYCEQHFDVFRARWCEHLERRPSKVCPFCDRCLCRHPAYDEPLFWKEAPPDFQAEGFDALFLLYL